ncbi:multiple monosaccharide ABC transporter permease [Propionibacteriaceae bacterium G1746]|uniref:multiple monosaccharide ABC transporter permease n=1 Tax=Aestuariimicrobium sp. G57 TaxID=3418485 RepID=UPI003C18D052
MKYLKQLFSGDVRQFGMLFALLALIIFFQWQSGGNVLTPTNMMNLLNGNSYILVLAIGMVLVIIAGHIDLSVGSVAAVVGISVALIMRDWNVNWFVGILIGLLIGAVIGAWHGFWVAYVGIPAFITTLAGMMLFRGMNQWIGKSNTIPVPAEFQKIGAGYLPEIGPNTGFNNLTLLLGILAIALLAVATFRRRATQAKLGAANDPLWVDVTKIVVIGAVLAYLTYLFGTGRSGTSFPISGLILVALVILYQFISQRTIIGRHVYAVGGNKHAAELSGVKTKRVNFLVMMNMSILAALAGMIFVARSTASGPFDGVGWELDAIAAVFIGGAAVSGGVGTVTGSMIGGLVMAVLNNGLQLMGIGADATQMIKGMVLLIAVAFDVYNKSQGKPSITGLITRNFGPKKPATVDAVEEQPDRTPVTASQE